MRGKRVEIKGEEILAVLTPLRKKWNACLILKHTLKGILLIGVLAYLLGGIGSLEHMWYVSVFFPIIMILIVLFNIFTRWKPFDEKAKREYADAYKRLISQPVLDSCFDNATFNPEAGYPREDFMASALMHISYSHEYKSEDLITGTYSGVAFRRADILITHMTSGKNRHRVIDADGRLLEIDFPKTINGTVRIVKAGGLESQSFGYFNSGSLINADSILELLGADARVEMEDVDFNQKFRVYAQDKHSAFYLLTPQFMEYIKQLYNRDDDVYIVCNGNKLYFLQSGHGGIFEPPKQEFDIWDEVRKCRAELEEIGEIIDLLQVR